MPLYWIIYFCIFCVCPYLLTYLLTYLNSWLVYFWEPKQCDVAFRPKFNHLFIVCLGRDASTRCRRNNRKQTRRRRLGGDVWVVGSSDDFVSYYISCRPQAWSGRWGTKLQGVLSIKIKCIDLGMLYNRLMLNFSKTKEELVFKRPRARCFHMPPAIDNIEQLDCCKLLGVIFQSNFNMDAHVQYLLTY